jgi:hypothetical protein
MATFLTGNTGSSTGEHLDFRVWDVNKGAYTDPSRFTSRMRVGDGLLTDQFSVTSPHGMREHPTKGGQRMHHGIDYGTPTGTAVTIEGGKFLTTFNDPGGGITSQYSITDDNGNPFEILLMHGSADNQVLSDGAITTGVPSGADPSTPSPIADETVAPANYADMSASQMNQAYDKLRMAGDVFAAQKEGLAMHKAFHKK